MLHASWQVRFLAVSTLWVTATGCTSGPNLATTGHSLPSTAQLPPDHILEIAETFERQGNTAKAKALYASVGRTSPDYRPTAERHLQTMAQRGNARVAEKPRQVARTTRRPAAPAARNHVQSIADAPARRNNPVRSVSASTRDREETPEPDVEESAVDSAQARQAEHAAAFSQLDSTVEARNQVAQQSRADLDEDARQDQLSELLTRLKMDTPAERVETSIQLSTIESNPRIILRTLRQAFDREESLVERSNIAATMLLFAPDDIAALRCLVQVLASTDTKAAAVARTVLATHAVQHEAIVAGQLAFLTRDNNPAVRSCAAWQLGVLKASGGTASIADTERAQGSRRKVQKGQVTLTAAQQEHAN